MTVPSLDTTLAAITEGKLKQNITDSAEYLKLLSTRIDKGRDWLQKNYQQGWMQLYDTNDRPFVADSYDAWIKQYERWKVMKDQRVLLSYNEDSEDVFKSIYTKYIEDLGTRVVKFESKTMHDCCLVSYMHPEIKLNQMDAEQMTLLFYIDKEIFPESKVLEVVDVKI